MPRARIRPEAAGALYRQADYYVRKKSPETAVRWVEQALATCEALAKDPWVGLRRPFRRYPEARVALIHGFKRHVVVYRQAGEDIEVLDFTQATRDLQRRLGSE